jgi:hypothetical protein
VGVNLYGLLAEKVLDGINNLLHWGHFRISAFATIITTRAILGHL